MEKWLKYLEEVTREFGLGLRAYVGAQLKLALISWGLFLLGLKLIGVSHFISLALGLALLDLVPILGSGLVFLPWIILSLVRGQGKFGLGLGLVYLLVGLLRQVLEMKILGDSLGLSPFYVFLASLVAALVLGPIGLVLGPVLAMFFKIAYLRSCLEKKDEE